MDDNQLRGRPLAQDPNLEPGAFLRRPANAPVYYGFPILDDTAVEGFRFGMITDFEAQADNLGDAFLVAPDDSRAGLVWGVTGIASVNPKPLLDLEPNRWGVWSVSFPYPMDSRENVRRNVAAILPEMRPHWERWKRQFRESDSTEESQNSN